MASLLYLTFGEEDMQKSISKYYEIKVRYSARGLNMHVELRTHVNARFRLYRV